MPGSAFAHPDHSFPWQSRFRGKNHSYQHANVITSTPKTILRPCAICRGVRRSSLTNPSEPRPRLCLISPTHPPTVQQPLPRPYCKPC